MRFVYEVFFQLLIGVTVFLAASRNDSKNFSGTSMALAIVLVLTSLAIVGFLVYSCFRDGPQIWGTY